MSRKIRLGPIAVFLAVVAVVLSTLAVLTVATTNADKVLADRFAGATQTRYALEAEGERFLQQYDEKVAGGSAVSAADRTKEIEKDGYTLKITVTEPDASGSWDVIEWKVIKDWNADDPYQNIWQGN
jgi:beta-lactam-binding protein with PASTA domain